MAWLGCQGGTQGGHRGSSPARAVPWAVPGLAAALEQTPDSTGVQAEGGEMKPVLAWQAPGSGAGSQESLAGSSQGGKGK